LRLGPEFVGIILFPIIGWLIGDLIEHPIGGALPFMGALIGVLLTLAILMLGEGLKETK
jgi:uncharacterized membrane protein